MPKRPGSSVASVQGDADIAALGSVLCVTDAGERGIAGAFGVRLDRAA